jgi:hypothetical protein
MRIAAMTTMAVLAGASGWAGESRTTAEPKVIVCMTFEQHLMEAYQAREIATQMFADIEVQVEWRTKMHSCPTSGAIVMKLTEDTPVRYHPGAFAFSLPYEGIHIQVFYDRVRKAAKPPMVSCLLAHVLAHEITHVLEGIDRHSEIGVMKAHWSRDDTLQMAWKPLAFAEEDKYLIHRGLKLGAAKLAAMDSAAGTVAAR